MAAIIFAIAALFSAINGASPGPAASAVAALMRARAHSAVFGRNSKRGKRYMLGSSMERVDGVAVREHSPIADVPRIPSSVAAATIRARMIDRPDRDVAGASGRGQGDDDGNYEGPRPFRF